MKTKTRGLASGPRPVSPPRKWWQGKSLKREDGQYVLRTVPCIRRNSKELAGAAVIVTVGGIEPIAMLVGIPTSSARDAGRAMFLAELFVRRSMEEGMADSGILKETGVIDWTRQPEPFWNEQRDKMEAAFCSEEWLQLSSTARFLHEHIERTCGPGHPLRDLFDLVQPDTEDEESSACRHRRCGERSTPSTLPTNGKSNESSADGPVIRRLLFPARNS